MQTRQGFTLMELLVVLTILGLLAAIVVPNVLGQLGSSKPKTARIQIEELGTALEFFYLETGRYPSTEEGLQALVENPNDLVRWKGPYLKKLIIPNDPWSRPYHYQAPGQNGPYDLFTLGRDGEIDGEDEDADVSSWQ